MTAPKPINDPLKAFLSVRTGAFGTHQNTRQDDMHLRAQMTIRQKKLKVSLAPTPWDKKEPIGEE